MAAFKGEAGRRPPKPPGPEGHKEPQESRVVEASQLLKAAEILWPKAAVEAFYTGESIASSDEATLDSSSCWEYNV